MRVRAVARTSLTASAFSHHYYMLAIHFVNKTFTKSSLTTSTRAAPKKQRGGQAQRAHHYDWLHSQIGSAGIHTSNGAARAAVSKLSAEPVLSIDGHVLPCLHTGRCPAHWTEHPGKCSSEAIEQDATAGAMGSGRANTYAGLSEEPAHAAHHIDHSTQVIRIVLISRVSFCLLSMSPLSCCGCCVEKACRCSLPRNAWSCGCPCRILSNCHHAPFRIARAPLRPLTVE